MKNSILSNLTLLIVIIISNPSYAQGDKTLRPSPPAETKAIIDGANVAIYYSTPSVKGRDLWGGLVPFGKVWRTGANEATVFETDKDLIVNGQKLPAGKYGLFTIPNEKEWTFIFNSVWDQFGAFKYDAAKDVLRIVSSPEASTEFHEYLRFDITDHDVIFSWENLKISFAVKS